MPGQDTMNAAALLTVEQMYRADAAAIAAGISGLDLMEAAGAAVFREIVRRWSSRPTAILCGPGNNGGDGFVVARLLAELGWPLHVLLLGKRADLKGDAAANAERWSGPIEPLPDRLPSDTALVVDALFGAGLARPLAGRALKIVHDMAGRGIDCITVDVPSGVDGDTGSILGGAPRA